MNARQPKPFSLQMLDVTNGIYGSLHKAVIRDSQWRNRRLPGATVRNETELKRALKMAHIGSQKFAAPTVWVTELRYSKASGRSRTIYVTADDEVKFNPQVTYLSNTRLDALNAEDVREILLKYLPVVTETSNPFKRF